VYVLAKGLVVAPTTTCWTGPWLGATRATPLQRVANRPILCHVLDALLEAGVLETAIVATPDVAPEIAACVGGEGPSGISVRHIVDDATATGGGALAAAADFVGEAPCLLHRADGLLGQPILSALEDQDEPRHDAVLLVQERESRDRRLRLVPSMMREDAGGDGSLLEAGLAGACLLGAGVLARLRSSRCAEHPLDFAALAAAVAQAGGSTRVRFARRWRHFTGDALELLDMNRAILDGLTGEAIADPDDGNRFEGAVAIHPSARVSSSIVIGPVIIGADALISDSYIGPHTSIAERVRIEGAELERSIVLAEASIVHVGSRLVASVVGRQAHIFRDFSMPRALRLQVGEGDEVALC